MFEKLKSLFSENNDKNIVDTKQNSVIEPKKSINSVAKDDFLNSLKVNVDLEIQTLKLKLDNGIINAIDLTDEQIDKLQEIYDKEIAEKKLKIQNLKRDA